MLTISKVFTILCLLCLCGNMEYPDSFQKKISKLFFQISAQVYSVPGQTEGRRKVFLGWTSIDLSPKLYLTCGFNVNYYKSVHHPIPTLPVGIGNTLTIFKTNQYALLSISVQVYSLLGQTEEERKAVFGRCKKEGCIEITKSTPPPHPPTPCPHKSTWLS